MHSHCMCLNVSANKPLAFLPFNLFGLLSEKPL